MRPKGSDRIGDEEGSVEWRQVIESPTFTSLVKDKKRTINSMLLLSLGLFVVMSVLATFTTLLDGRAVGALTWGFLFNLLLFAVALGFSLFYAMRADRWDRLAGAAQDKGWSDRDEK